MTSLGRLAGVIGHPIAHSMSPAIHTAALGHDGRADVYVAFDVHPDRLVSAVHGLRDVGALGVNVTLPHKKAVIDLADARSADVERLGASNLLLFDNGRIAAHNTDLPGFVAAVAELEVDLKGAACLLLGAGGAAAAAAWGLAALGVSEIHVANRTRSRADELVASLVETGVRAAVHDPSELDGVLRSVRLIVNATSVGLDGSSMPLGANALQAAAGGDCGALLDLVYGRRETPLVLAARDAGLRAADGLAMLVHQAAEAYALLFNGAPPIAIMRDAAMAAAGRAA